MPLTDPHDTLAYHRSRVLSQHRDWGEVSCADIAVSIKNYMAVDQDPDTVPETEALWFYLLNHGVAEIMGRKAPYEPLGDLNEFVETYYETLTPKVIRCVYYLLLICTRESRHRHSPTKAWLEASYKEFGKASIDFIGDLVGKGSDQAYKHFLHHPPAATLGQFCKALQHTFYNGKFGSGYGGPAWGAIADCLVRYVTGEYSGEMMLDTVWTLSHNNGPIFNKGMLYGGYSYHLVRILDVQRSGQIPEMVLHDVAVNSFVTPQMAPWATWLTNTFSDSIGKYVDWFKVEALGSKHKYSAEKNKQAALHGTSATLVHDDGTPIVKPAPKPKAPWNAPPAPLPTKETHFEIQPGVLVPKFKMKRAA